MGVVVETKEVKTIETSRRAVRRAQRSYEMKRAVAAANEKWFGDEGHGRVETPLDAYKQKLRVEDEYFTKMVEQMQLVADLSQKAYVRRSYSTPRRHSPEPLSSDSDH